MQPTDNYFRKGGRVSDSSPIGAGKRIIPDKVKVDWIQEERK